VSVGVAEKQRGKNSSDPREGGCFIKPNFGKNSRINACLREIGIIFVGILSWCGGVNLQKRYRKIELRGGFKYEFATCSGGTLGHNGENRIYCRGGPSKGA